MKDEWNACNCIESRLTVLIVPCSSALDLQVKSEVPFTRVVRSPADPDKIVTVGGGVLALWSLNALKREAPSVSFAASQSKIILCQKVYL